MANLHYANLPGVKNANQAGALAALARANLDNVETYLERVKKHQEQAPSSLRLRSPANRSTLCPAQARRPRS